MQAALRPLARLPNGPRAALVPRCAIVRPRPAPHRTGRPAFLPPPPTTTTLRFSSTTPASSPSAAAATSDNAAKTPATAAVQEPPPSPSTATAPPPPPPPPKKRRRISLRGLIYFTAFLGAGLVTGNVIRFTIVPPPLPEPGTELDDALQDKLRAELELLPQVIEMSGAPGWVEVAPVWASLASSAAASPVVRTVRRDGGQGTWAWMKSAVGLGGVGGKKVEGGGGGGLEDEGNRHLVSQSLASMKGFGPARRFYNPATRESVTVFWFGGGMAGWPGVAHGGAIAMAFLEAFGGKSTVDASKITLTYLKPTSASNFWVIRAGPEAEPEPSTELPPQKDMTKRPIPISERPASGGELWSGTLETVQGRLCVKANAVIA